MTQKLNPTQSDLSDDSPNINVMLSMAALVLTMLLVLILAGVALLLPPFNLLERLGGPSYAMLSAQSNAARSPDGRLTLILDPTDAGAEFGVALGNVPSESFRRGEGADWVLAAQEAVPTRLTLQSPVYTLETRGGLPERATVSLELPPTVSDMTRLDLYGRDETSGEWDFVASQPVDARTVVAELDAFPAQLALFSATSPSAPTVLVPVDVTTVLTNDVGNVATVVSPAGMQPTGTGELVGSLAAGVDPTASYRVMPVVRNFGDARALDVDTVTAILENDTLRATHVESIVNLAGGFGGGVC